MAKAPRSAPSKASRGSSSTHDKGASGGPVDLEDLEIISEARKRFKRALDFESVARSRAVEDQKFYYGDSDNGYQWPVDVRNQRDVQKSPTLTINMTRQFTLNVINETAEQRAGIKFEPVGDKATYEGAQVMTGLVKRIEADSHAQAIYGQAIKDQVIMGWGYWRVLTRYVDDDSVDQEIYIAGVADNMCVLLDPDASLPDKSDANFGFVYMDMPKDEFKAKYPNADMVGSSDGVTMAEGWIDGDHVRVAEYYRRRPVSFELVVLQDEAGQAQGYRSDKLPPAIFNELVKNPLARRRRVQTTIVEWFKIAGNEIIDRRTEKTGDYWRGSTIPLVKLTGEESLISGQYDCRGHVRFLKDPNRMYNYWSSAAVEQVALQTKVPFIGSARAISGYEGMWANANTSNYATLVYNDLDDQGNPVPPPAKVPAATMAPAYIQGMTIAQQEMRLVAGQHQEDLGIPSNAQSGAAVNARIRQSNLSTSHYGTRLAEALQYTGRIILELAPHIYDTQRVVQILGEDNTKYMVTIDPTMAQEYQQTRVENEAKATVIFRPGFAKYAVVVEAGPSLATRRQEAFTALAQLLQGNPQLLTVAGDLLFKSADFPLAGELADRLRRLVPPNVMGVGPSPNEQALMGQVETLKQSISELLQKNARNELEREDGALKHALEEFRATTERINAFMKTGQVDPEQIQLLVQQAVLQTLRVHLPEVPRSLVSHVLAAAPLNASPPPAPQPMPITGPMPGAPGGQAGMPGAEPGDQPPPPPT